MSEPVTTYLLLGSNLGDRAAHLAAARTTLAATVGEIVAASALYETAPWGVENQPAYLNQALALRTALRPAPLLRACQAAEQRAGRTRTSRWASRTLDVDVLLIGEKVFTWSWFTVPHPRLAERRFVLVPLAEIAGEKMVPGLQLSVASLLAQCPDLLPVQRWEAS